MRVGCSALWCRGRLFGVLFGFLIVDAEVVDGRDGDPGDFGLFLIGECVPIDLVDGVDDTEGRDDGLLIG